MQNPIQQYRIGDRVRAKNPIVTLYRGKTETDAKAGDAGWVIGVVPETGMVTVQWPQIVSDAHPTELERMQ